MPSKSLILANESLRNSNSIDIGIFFALSLQHHQSHRTSTIMYVPSLAFWQASYYCAYYAHLQSFSSVILPSVLELLELILFLITYLQSNAGLVPWHAKLVHVDSSWWHVERHSLLFSTNQPLYASLKVYSVRVFIESKFPWIFIL